MDVNLKPLVLDLIQNENLMMADKMIECLEKIHISNSRKYFLYMYLTPYVIDADKTSEELPSYYRFFH